MEEMTNIVDAILLILGYSFNLAIPLLLGAKVCNFALSLFLGKERVRL